MKKAIVIASFGCSIKDSREKYIETIENQVKNEYKEIDCFRVFTSEIIRRKMKREESIETDNMTSCLEKLMKDGYTHVYVVVTHIIPGAEYYGKIISSCDKFRDFFEEIKIARPLLDERMGNEETELIKSYVKTGLQKDEGVVLIGHGTHHEAHKYYEQFESLLKKEIPTLYMAHVEGNPYITDILDKLREDEIRKINLYPFLIVAGDHALNDIGSDEDDSVKSQLINAGFEVSSYTTGLGAYEKTISLFINRLKEII